MTALSHPGARARWLLLAAASGLPACTNFHVVEENRLYRSGQPSARQLERWIEDREIATVFRLRGGDADDLHWRASHDPARDAGIDFVQLRLSARRWPTRAELLGLWEVFATAEYPMLVHCKAGADRTSLASAIYVLQRTGNLELARGQIALLPYFHVGWDTWRLGAVLDLYEPFHGEVPFPEWVREHYSYPGMAEKEGTAEPEATAEPEGTLEPQGTTEPEGTAEPQGTTEPEGTAAATDG